MIRKTIVIAAFFSATIGGQASMQQAAAQQAALVEVDAVVSEPLGQTVPVLGRLVAQQRADVAALVQGPVAEVAVQIGDVVEKGDVLVKLSDRRIRQSRNLQAALLQQAKANLKAKNDALNLSGQELKRLEKLKSSAAFSAARMEDKQLEQIQFASQVAVAEAAVAAANANLALAEIDLSRSVIKAPFKGVITAKYTEVGAFVNKGAAVVSVVNYEDLEVEADVPSNRLSGLENGRLVQVYLTREIKYDAVVRAIIPEENGLTRTRAVRFMIAVPKEDLKTLASGQSVSVYVPVGATRQIISVHKDALISKGDDFIAYVVEQGKANIRTVKVGDAVGGRFEIVSGLNVGDLVVTRGNERLRPGQSVMYPGMPETEQSGPETEQSGS